MAAQRYEFYFQVVKTIFNKRAQHVSKILFSAQENKIHIFKPLCFIIWSDKGFYRLFAQTAMKKREMTSSISSLVRIWKICHSGPGCSFV